MKRNKLLISHYGKSGKQAGVALITVVLVMAVAVVLALQMTDQGLIEIRRDMNLDQARRARYLQQGLEDWAIQILQDDWERGQDDFRGEAWAQTMPPMPADQAIITGNMVDMDGRFNLNNLIIDGVESEIQIARLTRLLRVLNLPVELADQILDWLDDDSEPRPKGAEDSVYQRLGYYTANGKMQDITELRLIAGVDADIYHTLIPHVTALNDSLALNVNTASEEVVMSLYDNISASLASKLVQGGRAHYQNTSDFTSQLVEQGVVISENNALGVASHYFLLSSEIEIDHRKYRFSSVIYRGFGGIQVISRRLNWLPQ